MKFASLRKQVFDANLELVRRGLVLYTFGNASGIDRAKGIVVIKPSGIPYEKMRPADMVAVDLDGKVVEGKRKPSSDLATHLILYREFPKIGGVVHTHSRCATLWAQAGREIPCFGTTHADYFYGPIPVTTELSPKEIEQDYEANTGHAIVRRLRGIDPLSMPAVLVRSHAPFTWGQDVAEAAYHAVVLEEVAHLALETRSLNPEAQPISRALLDKHYCRKHGHTAYYGQKKR
jgi:L-ribulose-5-phosphate 4-epimerase